MSQIKLPKVDLLDITREPTDDELEALMRATIESANAKWRSTRDRYTEKLFRQMKVAAKEGADWAKEIESYKSAT